MTLSDSELDAFSNKKRETGSPLLIPASQVGDETPHRKSGAEETHTNAPLDGWEDTNLVSPSLPRPLSSLPGSGNGIMVVVQRRAGGGRRGGGISPRMYVLLGC